MEQLDLVGFTVMRCGVDFTFRLLLARPVQAVRGQEWAWVMIEGPFEYVANGVSRSLVPNGPHPEELGPALNLLSKTIEAAVISDDGTLRLEFSDERVLQAPSLPQYEAWEVHEHGKMIVCLPGGGISTWQAPPTQPHDRMV